MRFVIQRVTEASVSIDGVVKGKIGRGFCVLIGVSREDDESVCDRMVKKLLGLRIFEDAQGKTNLSLEAVGGELLLISQFTLYADCRRGNRPGFTYAGEPDRAKALYEGIIRRCRDKGFPVKEGVFGADMKVALTNDGPFTIILDSEEL